MKIIVNKAVIEGAANLLSKVINRNNALPILCDILCEVKEQKMVMSASDSEVTLTTTIQLDEMEGDGRFCVNATWLKDALSQLADQPVTILATTESNMMFTIQHSTGETYFPMEDADDYPMPMLAEYNEVLVNMKGEWLRSALKRSLWATADDELRPVMNGVAFAISKGYLDIVACDGHVMVKSRYSVIDEVTPDCSSSFVMPKRVAKLMSDIVEEGDLVNIEWNERNGYIAVAGYDITFRLIEGKYPNYNSVIPSNQPLCATVPRAFMVNSIRNVIPFTSDNNGKMIRMAFDADKLTLTGEDIDFATGAHDTIAIDYASEPVIFGVSGSRLLTIMSKLSGQECNISMTNPSIAMVVEPVEQPDDCEVTMLIMPMLLND